MTSGLPYKDVCLDRYQGQDTLDLINRKLLIHKQLEKPPRNYAVYSDLHGSYEKFLHWLKNGLGFYRIVVGDTLGESYSQAITESYEQLLYIINRARFVSIEDHIESDEITFDSREYFFEPVPQEFCTILDRLEGFGLTRKRVFLDCLRLLRDVTRGDERRIIKIVPNRFLENILKLYHQSDEESFAGLIKGIVDSKIIYQFMSSLIVRLVVYNVFDKHINLGDTYDRGSSADKLIKLYRTYFGDQQGATPMQYIWGNHDILWMGAAVGNEILCIDALRISLRYNNTEFLDRYGFDLSELTSFALATYEAMPEGSYVKTKDFSPLQAEIAAKTTKALLVIQTKLTVQLLQKACETADRELYSDEYQRHLELLAMLPTGVSGDPKEWARIKEQQPLLRDVYFPTIDPANPSQLTPQESALVTGIVSQFKSLKRLQTDINWMLEKGEIYRVVDNTLYFHAAIPAEMNQGLVGFRDLSGKAYLDNLRDEIKGIAQKHNRGEALTIGESMLFWHLWCGSRSPFFCKSKMATLERSVFNQDEAAKSPLTTHAEISNPFYKHIRDNGFLNKLLEEFHAERICIGHTPIKTMKQAILSDSIRAFIVDGGASQAYGDRGVVLIYTPEYSYLTFHPSMEELEAAERENRLPPIQVQRLEERGRLRLRHMEKGYFLEKELEAIDEILETKLTTFSNTYFLANAKSSSASTH